MKNIQISTPGSENDETPRFQEYIHTLDWGPGNRDESGFKAALRSAAFGIDPENAAELITEKIRSNGGHCDLTKVWSQLRRAHDFVHSGETLGDREHPRYPAPKFDPEKLEALAIRAPGIDREWFKLKSPVKVEGLTSADFLEQLYSPGENVLVFKSLYSQGDIVFEVGGDNEPIQRFTAEGVWFLINPVDGQFHPNPRYDGKDSRRSEESVTDWRYLVIESDVAEEGAWLSCLPQMPLKISAIYTSGGKSIHALVRIDAKSKDEWDREGKRIKAMLVPLGADANAITGVRLSRLPGVMRGVVEQELLYLNPYPQATPIFSPTGQIDELEQFLAKEIGLEVISPPNNPTEIISEPSQVSTGALTLGTTGDATGSVVEQVKPHSPTNHLKQKVSFSALLQRDGHFPIPGGSFKKCVCPFCLDKGANFYIRPADDGGKCYKCEWKGDIFDYVRKRDEVDFMEAYEIVDELAPSILRNAKVREEGNDEH